ncbi:MAG: S8/S53 family peptidase [Bacteroidota bacterium]
MIKKICLLVTMFSIVHAIAFSQNSGIHKAGLSPITKEYLTRSAKSGTKSILSKDFVYQKISGQYYLSAFLKVNEYFENSSISALGAKPGTRAGNILTVQLPLDKVEAIRNIPGIDYIQLDEPVFIALDSARHDTHVDSVHAGINLPMAYSGKNVVVGIIDAGFDFTHPTLMDTSGNYYRVKKVWEQKSAGTPPAGYTYGNELADSASIWSGAIDVNAFSHGTHVAGISGGSGFGSDSTNSRFRGMAFESDLVFVCIKPDPDQWTTTGMTNIIDGIKYIFDYADAVGKPAVVNLSWGCSMGPHDGTSLFSQAVDNMTGPGKIFVCSAGNNGENDIHLHKKLTATDTLLKTVVNFSSYLPEKKTWVDTWGNAGDNYCAMVTLYQGSVAGQNTGFICLDDSLHATFLISTSGDTCFLGISTAAAEYNGKPRIFFDIYNKSTNRILITLKSSSADIHMWTGFVQDYSGYYGKFSSGSIPGASNGTRDVTISDFATTHSCIAVAAFASKVNYIGINGVPSSYSSYVAEGNITPFSSHGPAADSATKPDIAAPGMVLGSAINSYDSSYMNGGASRSDVISCYNSPINGRDYCYGMMSGTSMSSPVASGIVALLLQVRPQLTPDDVKNTLQHTAITDNFTGVIPPQGSFLWGFGKINAYAAVMYAWQQTNIAQLSGVPNNFMVYPNPNNGNFSVDYFSASNESVMVSVTDMAGRIIINSQWNVTAGRNIIKLDLESISNGIYLLNVTSHNGLSVYQIAVQH